MLTRKHVVAIVLIAFLLSIVIRIPNLHRPLSKHHEYLPAVVLINAISWKQAGGGYIFHYTPVMNYQNKGDKFLGNEVLTKDGNVVYLSIGPGWYMLPYFFFTIADTPVSVAGLRILNLLFGLLTLMLCILLFNSILSKENRKKNTMIVTACLVMLFSPGALWYSGNGYTHTFMMLPFAILVMMALLPMFEAANRISGARLILLFFLLLLGIYMDWFTLFIGVTAIVYSLFKLRQDRRYLLLTGIIVAGLICGVSLIFWQFASYAGFEETKQYWEGRFQINRSLPGLRKTAMLIMHYVTAYLPLLIALFLCLASSLRKGSLLSGSEKSFAVIWGGAVVLYHLNFSNWSFVHEFSVIPASPLIAFLFARYCSEINLFSRPGTVRIVMASVMLLGIAQYYYINPPGKTSLIGMRYDTYEILGKSLRNIDREHKIFMKMIEANPMIEYYAGRNLTNASDTVHAKSLMKEWGLKEAVWVEQEDFILKRIIHLKERSW